MPNVLWLDDEHHSNETAADQLRLAGYELHLLGSEMQVLALLEEGFEPDILIQDLFRPPSRTLEPDQPAPMYERDSPASAGWRFYERFLRRYRPNLPVVIYSLDADVGRNKLRADDFNLTLIPKLSATSELVAEVDRIIRSQQRLLEGAPAFPSIIVPDFEKVNRALIEHLYQNPAAVHDVSWSSFEKLVARLLIELGYDVETTKLTRDGGVDLWAIHRHDLGETLYAIDAKKYAPDRLVGPEPVRAIRGVASLENATVGMIVTTSTFGPAALALAQQYRFLLSLKDFQAVSEWIRRVATDSDADKLTGASS